MQLLLGDCLDRLKELPSASVDSIVTDPPYGLSFMGKKWDYDVPSLEVWQECLRVLKPGGHLLSFAGSRTYHRMAVRIEDAGFEIRDQIMWLYGSGFPKSLDVSKAIDKAAGAEREDVYESKAGVTTNTAYGKGLGVGLIERRPATEAAKKWNGWGTALKPAHEPIVVARKPLIGTVAENVLEYGTGAINIDGCRVGTEKIHLTGGGGGKGTGWGKKEAIHEERTGRFPANLIHDGSEEVLAGFPVTAPAKAGMRGDRAGVNTGFGGSDGLRGHNDAGGSAARFFYCAKASKKDRDEGLEGFAEASAGTRTGRKDGTAGINAYAGATGKARNIHPTVKPTELMRYLCRLITPPGGVVLDPFMGSGSTGKAAKLEGFDFIGIEREEDYMKIAEARINAV